MSVSVYEDGKVRTRLDAENVAEAGFSYPEISNGTSPKDIGKDLDAIASSKMFGHLDIVKIINIGLKAGMERPCRTAHVAELIASGQLVREGTSTPKASKARESVELS